MILFGKISSIETDTTFKVVISSRENTVSPAIPKAKHVGNLVVGDNVVIAFDSCNLAAGIIIATY